MPILKWHLHNQQAGEEIILLLRRHIIILIFKSFAWGLVAILPIIFAILFAEVLQTIFQAAFWPPLFALAISIFYLYVWLFIFHSFVDYYLDVWIVTTHRVISMEQRGLFYRAVSEQRLHRVQDVTAEIHGVFSTIFNYGTIYIQTAGQEPRFIFKQIPDPTGTANQINKLTEKNKRLQEIQAIKE